MIYTVTEGILKMQKFCAYQDRCQSDVRQKLAASGLKGEEAEFVISELISGGFLNEERFARSFARGKFRINKWGRIKIESALKMKGISQYCIRRGMLEIAEAEYLQTARTVIRKLNGDKAVKSRTEQVKLISKMRAKGFEAQLVLKLIGGNREDDF